jgi:hypothetical protein
LSDNISGSAVEKNVTDLLEMILLAPHQKPKPPNFENRHVNIPTDALEVLFKTQAPHNIDALNKMAKWTDSQIEKYFLRSIGVQKRGRVKKPVPQTTKSTPHRVEKEEEVDNNDRKVSFKTSPNSPPQQQDELQNIAELVWSREDLPSIEPELPRVEQVSSAIVNPHILPPKVNAPPPIARPMSKQELAKLKEKEEEMMLKKQQEQQRLEVKKKEDERKERKERLRRLEHERKQKEDERLKKLKEEEEKKKQTPQPAQSDGFEADFEVDFDDFPSDTVVAPVTKQELEPVHQPVNMTVDNKSDFGFDAEWGELQSQPVMTSTPAKSTPVISTNGTNGSASDDNLFFDDGFGEDINQFVSDLPDLSFVVSPTNAEKKKTDNLASSLDDFF